MNYYNNSQKQFDYLDILNIMSFVVGLKNLEENMGQSDKQELIHDLGDKADLLLREIHGHLQEQDEKINLILEKIEKLEKGV